MDDLERRVRAARPLSGHRDLPLTDRAKRELADLVLTAPQPAGRQRRRPRRHSRAFRAIGAMTVTVTVAVLGGIAIATVSTPNLAVAATPPVLSATPTMETTETLLTEIVQGIDLDGESPSGDVRIEVEAWTLHTDDTGQATSSSVVPERYDITRGADGSYATTVTTGQAVDDTGNPVADAPAPGALVWEESWRPGEYGFLSSGPFPDSASEVGPYLQNALGTDEPVTSAAAIQATNDLLLEQVLSPTQLTALLQFFAAQADLRPLGEVTDRQGRAGIAFAADDSERPGYERHLIVSPETGRILATETLYTGTDRTDIPSPSVVNYFVWI